MHEYFKTIEDEYEEAIVEAITSAAMGTVKVCPVEQLHQTETKRIEDNPGYEFI